MKQLLIIIARLSIVFALIFIGKYIPAGANSTAAANTESFLPLSVKDNLASSATTYLYLPILSKNAPLPEPLWRFGAALTRRPLTDYDAAGVVNMRFGWYVDFAVNLNGHTNPYGMDYMPTVRVRQLKVKSDSTLTSLCCVSCTYAPDPNHAAILGVTYNGNPTPTTAANLAHSHPGLTWLIGNEIDRRDTGSDAACGSQDEMLPELYAHVYHDYYASIKTADPTAQIAIAGVVQFTALRQMYLDRILAEYQSAYGEPMPVDVWNTHLYVLQEVRQSWGADIPPGFTDQEGAQYGEQHTLEDNKDFNLAWAQIVALRTWMKSHTAENLQNKPLIITEYGVLFPSWLNCYSYPDTRGCPFTDEEVRDKFMYPSFNAFLNNTDAAIGYPLDGNRLVQRWNWFSIDYDEIYPCSAQYPNSNVRFGGSLFNSGLNIKCLPTDPNNSYGITTLGTYWLQYVENLPPAAAKPYAP